MVQGVWLGVMNSMEVKWQAQNKNTKVDDQALFLS